MGKEFSKPAVWISNRKAPGALGLGATPPPPNDLLTGIGGY